MINNENRQELIESYLRGELEDNDFKKFEEELKKDKVLKEDVILTGDVLEALDNAYKEQLFSEKLSKLGLADKYLNNNELEKTSSPKKYIIGAIIIILGFILGIFILQKVTTPESKEIFASYYEPYPTNSSIRNDSNLNQDYLNAVNAYDNGNYKEAIIKLTQRLDKYPSEISTQLLLANSYLSTIPPETEKGISIFKNITRNESNLYTTTANWYLALAYLQNDQRDEAKIIFEQLALKNSGRYSKLSKEILSNWD